ncbi:MAG: hypothetical protein ACK4GO_05470 [Gemmobacter sp.]
MPDPSPTAKVFSFDGNGLSYTITVAQGEDGVFRATIQVTEGRADINAIYWGDDVMAGRSASLHGPLNMNGGGTQYEGQPVQWDGALKLSDPGLGRAGANKATFLQAGGTLEIALPIDSLDDVAFLGIRATSTSTPGGSIKAVTPGTDVFDDDDDDDDDDDCDDDCDVCATPVSENYPDLTQFDQQVTSITFGVDFSGNGEIDDFYPVTRADTGLDTPTFADYVATLDERLLQPDPRFTDSQLCDAEPVKAIIYGTEGSAFSNGPYELGYYNFATGVLDPSLEPVSGADTLPSVPVENEDMVMDEDEDTDALELV